MENEIFEHINKMVDYLYESEYKHWEESGKPKNHIFNSAMEVRKWIEQEQQFQK